MEAKAAKSDWSVLERAAVTQSSKKPAVSLVMASMNLEQLVSGAGCGRSARRNLQNMALKPTMDSLGLSVIESMIC